MLCAEPADSTIPSRYGAAAHPPEGLMLQPFSRVIALVGFATTLALSCSDAFAGAPPPPPPTRLGSGATSADASSGVGGAHFGYNWQQGAAVFGFATDLQATHLATSSNATLIYPAGPGPIL